MESEFLSECKKVVLWKGQLVREAWLQMLIKGNLLLSFFLEIPCAELKDQEAKKKNEGEV